MAKQTRLLQDKLIMAWNPEVTTNGKLEVSARGTKDAWLQEQREHDASFV